MNAESVPKPARPRRVVTLVSGIGALLVSAWFLWRGLGQRSEAQQLISILTGDSVADAAWARERLWHVGDEELRGLPGFLEDSRPTLLETDYGKRWRGPKGVKLLVGSLVSEILIDRTGANDAEDDDIARVPRAPPERWSSQLWSTEVERFVETHQSWIGRRIAPHPGGHSWLRGLFVRPPSPPGSVGDVIAALRGGDRALAIWTVETLRCSPDEAVAALLPHSRSTDRFNAPFFHWKDDPVTNERGLELGRLVQLLLAERPGDEVLSYNVRRGAEGRPLYKISDLADKLEAAWRARPPPSLRRLDLDR